MSLIDRYIYEVGRFIPRKERGDIQAELRSSVVDNLEDRYGPEPTDAQVEELLKELGRPRQVAASYHPEGQYLVGPVLYPLFRMVAWIVVVAVLGAQLLAWGISMLVAGESFTFLEIISSLVNSVPASLGWVLITFMILQYFDAKPYPKEEPWDPRSLPEINPDEDLKRGEMVFSMVMGVLLLVLVTFFPQWIGIVTFPGGEFYPNPVILDFLIWIQIGLAAGILLNIYLFWKGRMDWPGRIAKLVLSLYTIGVLALLVQGHTLWLAARSSSGLMEGLTAIENLKWELVGMHAYRWGFLVALIVSSIEFLVSIYRLIKSKLGSDFSPKAAVVEIK
ncbi:MAG: HAAS signaling domain-containing protein [Anaerolineales bacterium]